jgi:hypothetical protein
MGLCLQHLIQYADEGEDLLNRIVTGNESRVHHYQPESKRASLQIAMETPQFTSTKKCKFTPSAWKFMLIVFWDSRGALLAHFQ